MFSNNQEPISAFAVYRKSTKNKIKSKSSVELPAKKPKLKRDVAVNSNGTAKVVNNVGKQNGSPKLQKKAKKKIKKLKERKNKSLEDEEEPPLLVPVASNNLVSKKAVKNRETPLSHDYNEASISEFLTDLNKTDPSPDGLKLFKWLIAPLTPKSFFETYWEEKVLFVNRNQNTYYSQILTTERLDGIFRDFPLHYTRNVDVVSYDNGVKETHNDEGRVSAAALYDYYSNGCSIRVLNPQTYDQKVHLLLATLQEYFGTMVGANLYLTPPDSQGFAPHYDDIEAFIIQLEGRKHWKLYRPKGADVLARDSSPNLKRENIGEPFMEVTLNAGDLLYFPRGTIHEGRTDSEAHSFHITVSVYQHTAYADLLEHILPDALKRAATEDVEFRKGLPLNYLKHLGCVNRDCQTKERAAIINKVHKLMKTLINYADVDKAADNLGRKFMHDSMPPVLGKKEARLTAKLDGDYIKNGKIFNRVEIGMDTEVRLLRYYCFRLVEEGENAHIYFNTDNAKVYHGEEEQVLTVSSELIPCIKKLQNSYPEFVTVEDLPLKDNILKATLVADLWERGLLVTNGPLPPVSSDGSDEED